LVTFSTAPRDTSAIWIINISGELNSAIFKGNVVEFNYTEEIASCYVILNNKPDAIYIDNVKSNCQVYDNEDNEFVLKLPQGTHSVKIRSK